MISSDSEDYCDDLILLHKFDTVDTANSVNGDSLFSDDEDKRTINTIVVMATHVKALRLH